MTMIPEIFLQPFMQRAFIAGGILGILLAALGIFVTLRRMAFFGDGIAHSSLAGIAVAVLGGFAPLPTALIWAVLVAAFIYWFERATKLPSDTIVGIFFTASMALGVVLMSFTTGYRPELLTFLFGSILAIRPEDPVIIAAVALPIMLWLGLSARGLILMSLSEETAVVKGVPVALQTFIFYVALALAAVLGVKILGIILVSALMILPPAISRLMTQTFRSYFIGAIIIAEIVIFAGLVVSYLYDLPSGAVIVLLGTALFFLTVLARGKQAFAVV